MITCLEILRNENKAEGTLIHLLINKELSKECIEIIVDAIISMIFKGKYTQITIKNFLYYFEGKELILLYDYVVEEEYTRFFPELELLYFMNNIWNSYRDYDNFNVLKYYLYTFYVENFNDFRYVEDINELYYEKLTKISNIYGEKSFCSIL